MNREALGAGLALLNASLNAAATMLLVSGFLAIRKKRIPLHKKLMGGAFGLSLLFLTSYLIRLALTGTHPFPGAGWLQTVYRFILFTHITLAATVPFLAGRTLYLAWKKRFPEHRKIARFTLPIWLYVSVTGVVVYWMLYHL